MPVLAARLALSLAAALPLAAQANTFCCEVNSKTYCDDAPPQACYGKAYRQVNNKGVVIKRYDAPLTPEQQAIKDAELARQREEEEKKVEQERQDRKLLSMYATLSDLDFGHEAQLNDLKKGRGQMQQKLAELEKKKLKLTNEVEFYRRGKVPPDLKSQMDAADHEMEAQKTAIQDRDKEIETAKARFADERQRYLKLTAGR